MYRGIAVLMYWCTDVLRQCCNDVTMYWGNVTYSYCATEIRLYCNIPMYIDLRPVLLHCCTVSIPTYAYVGPGTAVLSHCSTYIHSSQPMYCSTAVKTAVLLRWLQYCWTVEITYCYIPTDTYVGPFRARTHVVVFWVESDVQEEARSRDGAAGRVRHSASVGAGGEACVHGGTASMATTVMAVYNIQVLKLSTYISIRKYNKYRPTKPTKLTKPTTHQTHNPQNQQTH